MDIRQVVFFISAIWPRKAKYVSFRKDSKLDIVRSSLFKPKDVCEASTIIECKKGRKRTDILRQNYARIQKRQIEVKLTTERSIPFFGSNAAHSFAQRNCMTIDWNSDHCSNAASQISRASSDAAQFLANTSQKRLFNVDVLHVENLLMPSDLKALTNLEKSTKSENRETALQVPTEVVDKVVAQFRAEIFKLSCILGVKTMLTKTAIIDTGCRHCLTKWVEKVMYAYVNMLSIILIDSFEGHCNCTAQVIAGVHCYDGDNRHSRLISSTDHHWSDVATKVNWRYLPKEDANRAWMYSTDRNSTRIQRIQWLP